MLHSAGIGKLDVNGGADHSEGTAQTAVVNRYVKLRCAGVVSRNRFAAAMRPL
jgi:hypothetical protein